jgi:hypothetical protein
MQLSQYVASISLLVTLGVSQLFAGTIVAPNAQTSTVGNDNSGSLAGSIASLEVEDLWASSEFASVGQNLLITSLAFRLKPGTGSLASTAASYSLFLSTTSVAPGSSSSTFATNRGSDYKQVLSGSGALWNSAGCTGVNPCAFDIVFTFTTPFLSDPSKGNLLTDLFVTGYNGTGTGEFDVENYLVPAAAKVGELVSFTAGSPTGSVEFSDNVTQFTFTSTPEPSTFLLFAGATLAAMVRRTEVNK